MTAFAEDLSHQMAAMLPGHPSERARLQFMVTNSEFHCVAIYRFGRLARAAGGRGPALGRALMATYRILNYGITHLDHLEISSHADIGPGLLLMHRHGIIIGPAVIGRNCVIHQNVTIGQRVAGGDHGVPRIGDNVWIGPGAVITGDIAVGDGVTISAGSVLSKDVPGRSLVAGNPARVIARDYDNSAMIGEVGSP
ncbi:Serine acetyltransferase [Acidipropionibacterium virtanenii]|uniref:Serine acetyltransferase n=2 Tax=Acidipropionibacterium virtanenii TaxID=2057246 RepID=A0A344UTV1_9ACTN|nr:Serine acetyltransferase [Acidipropionibacterium virtanenii]